MGCDVNQDFYFVSDSSEVIDLFFFTFITLLLKSSDFSDFDHISEKNGWFTSQIWYDDFPFRKFIRFPDFFPDFSGFSSNLQISSQNRWITSHIWYNYPFRKFNLFFFLPGFFRIFPDFRQIFTFLHRMYDLLLTYDMMISFSGYFSGFFQIFIKSSGFFTEWVVYFSCMVWWFCFSKIYLVFRIFSGFFQIFNKSSDVFFTMLTK